MEQVMLEVRAERGPNQLRHQYNEEQKEEGIQ